MLEANLFKSVKELAESGYLFRITDNGGETLDRYTVIFCDGDYLSLSETGAGVSLWGEGIDPADWHERVESGDEVDLALGDLWSGLQQHILRRVNEAWRDYLNDVMNRVQNAVAKSRETADVNDGIHTSAGVGIYSTGDGFCIRLDGDNGADDLGPYMTAEAALRATLPDDYALSGPEYHSTVNVNCLKQTPGASAKVKRLAKKVQAA